MEYSRKIQKQINGKFERMKAFGESKRAHLARGLAEGDKYKYTKDKIFSYKTFTTYKTNIEKAFNEIQKANPDTKFKDINQIEKEVPAYIERLIDEGKSAWTIQAYTSALSKFYGKSNDEWGIALPVRNRDDIVRTRNTRERERFSEKLNPEVVRWARNSGLRRSELENIRKEDCRIEGEKMIIHVKGQYAKGGQDRTVTTLAEGKDLDKMLERLEHLEPRNKVFGAIKAQAPIHKYRAEFAREMYDRKARPLEQIKNKKELYVLRGGERAGEKYDRLAMREVSEALGHHRLDVVVNNYLQGGY